MRAQTLWDELCLIQRRGRLERTGVINLGPANSTFSATLRTAPDSFQLDVEEMDAPAIMARWPEDSRTGRLSWPIRTGIRGFTQRAGHRNLDTSRARGGLRSAV